MEHESYPHEAPSLQGTGVARVRRGRPSLDHRPLGTGLRPIRPCLLTCRVRGSSRAHRGNAVPIRTVRRADHQQSSPVVGLGCTSPNRGSRHHRDVAGAQNMVGKLDPVRAPLQIARQEHRLRLRPAPSPLSGTCLRQSRSSTRSLVARTRVLL